MHVEVCSWWVWKELYNNNTKINYEIISIRHTHCNNRVEPFHFLIRSLNMFKCLVDFIWWGILFQIFGPKLSKLLVPKATCLFLGILKFSLYCCLTGLEHNFNSKISFINLGLVTTIRSHILKQTCSWKLEVCLSMCDLSVNTLLLQVNFDYNQFIIQ